MLIMFYFHQENNFVMEAAILDCCVFRPAQSSQTNKKSTQTSILLVKCFVNYLDNC